jgi:hypothetical protein
MLREIRRAVTQGTRSTHYVRHVVVRSRVQGPAQQAPRAPTICAASHAAAPSRQLTTEPAAARDEPISPQEADLFVLDLEYPISERGEAWLDPYNFLRPRCHQVYADLGKLRR